jgi:hypothetical protein
VTSLIDKIGLLHDALSAASLDHAFGGALALAWCTEQARGTIDIDLNVFVEVASVDAVLAGLPSTVRYESSDRDVLLRDGQVGLWWDTTPIDIFLNTTPFHESAMERVRVEPFAGRQIPFLGCSDLAVFKAFFNRTKDWADIEAMIAIESLDIDRVLGVLVRYLGADDERVARLRSLVATPPDR